MKYLVEANVLSETTKPIPKGLVGEWLRVHEREIALDPVILGELRFQILSLPKGRKRESLERWLDTGVKRLHWMGRTAGAPAGNRKSHAHQGQPDRDDGRGARLDCGDRNRADFEKAGVRVLNPFAD